MPEPDLIVFGGPTSQTGTAVRERLGGIDTRWENEAIWKGKSFEHIKKMLCDGQVLAVLPMWNSYVGAIEQSHALEMLFEEKAKLYLLWPNEIIFECAGKVGIELGKIKTIISVDVAETQCSRFIQEQGAKFLKGNSTTDSFEKFVNDYSINAVLYAPGQNQQGFNVLCKNASNPTNFTTFILLGSIDSSNWIDGEWGSLYKKLNPKVGVYFGVQMPIRAVAFSDDQKLLFDELTNGCEAIDDIPEIIFVARRSPDRCGLLVEAKDSVLPDGILTEEGYSNEVEVVQGIGKTNSRYTEEVFQLFNNKFSAVVRYDFIRHKNINNNTCFFACPPLGIVLHGYEDFIVEPVARLVIDKYFELYNNGIRCTKIQKEFFEKHNQEYLEHGMDFIKFVDIGTMI